MILAPKQDDELCDSIDAIELLIKEARQKSRRRRMTWGAVILIVMAAIGAAYLLSRSTSPPLTSSPSAAQSRSTLSAVVGPLVTPKHPYSMAVSAAGTLYVVDAGRDQILRRTSNGLFRVVAGTGRRGFSGDGGEAIKADIAVNLNSGIAVSKNGTVYFADTSNGRVREILPSGVIETVIGGGTEAIGTGELPARDVALSKLDTANDVTIAPNGELYVAAGAIYRLGTNGVLQWVVGKNSVPTNWGGVYANPAAQRDFQQPDRLAFDGRGDLLEASGGGWGLYERTASGELRFLENFRGDGDFGSLVTASNGSVVLASRFGLFQFSPSRGITSLGVSEKSLNHALGKMRNESRENIFIGGDGVAVSPNGAIYVDANTGSTFTAVNAILKITTQGQVLTLWKS